MKISNSFVNKCENVNDYFVLFLMSIFFIAGYLLFKRKPKLISPVLKRKSQLDKNNMNKKLIEENKEDMKFFLENNYDNDQ